MTVENTKVIDIITINSVTGAVELVITDHLQFEGNDEHLFVLQEKINTYLSFVESGELQESFPSAKGRPIVFKIICRFHPVTWQDSFLARLKSLFVMLDSRFHMKWRLQNNKVRNSAERDDISM